MRPGKELYGRAGSYQIKEPDTYRVFVPKPLPPDPPVEMDEEMVNLLSLADRALGRLDGATAMIPNPDLFVYGYVRKEAVVSSQIEGTQSSMTDLLEYEAGIAKGPENSEIKEVHNYVEALKFGLAEVEKRPLTLDLLKDIHAVLLKDVRGTDWSPGEFRKTQNWIGRSGGTIDNADFVPPPPEEMRHAVEDLERYMRFGDKAIPILIKAGLVKGQFETIHPFADGNGRMGRLLITLMLCEQKALDRPLLYLSDYFRRHRGEYFARLQDMRDHGNWEAWLKFFLRGVHEISEDAYSTALEILRLREKHRQEAASSPLDPGRSLELLECLYNEPYLGIELVVEKLKVSYPYAVSLIRQFVLSGILVKAKTAGDNPAYCYEEYVNILQRGTQSPSAT